MSLMFWMVAGVLTVSAQAPPTMTPEECLAATENFIALMHADPSWQPLVQKEGQLELMRSQAKARCAKPIDAQDHKALTCLTEAKQMSELQTCMSPLVAAMQSMPVPPPPPSPPPPMDIPADSPVTQEVCLKVQAHIFAVMVANPKLSAQERSMLMSARKGYGAQSDARACKTPISPEGQDLLRCLGSIRLVPAMEACIAAARQEQAKRLRPLLLGAQAHTERIREVLMAQQAAGEPLVAFVATPSRIGPGAEPVASLPDGPGKAMLVKLGLKSVHCTYAVHTHQYNSSTGKNDGPAIAGGFILATQCDLDNDGTSAQISASAAKSARIDTPESIF